MFTYQNNIQKKQQFLTAELFMQAADHQDIHRKLQENALLLSRIFAHQNQKSKSSVIDLFLAARLMYTQSSLLITGNKKDFPSCVFDTVGTLNIEQIGDGSMRVFSLVEFNQRKFEENNKNLEKLGTR